MFEVADIQYVLDDDKIIYWDNGGMVVKLLSFSSFSFVRVDW